MGRAKKRADRIRAEIPIVSVLSSYGYDVHPEGGDREQQFSCDLHGSGRDVKPSARAYPMSNSWFCFGCDRARDAIQTVREKEGIGFWQACGLLESRFGLPPLPWSDDDEAEIDRPKSISQAVQEALRSDRTFEQERDRVHRLLESVTEDRDIPMRMLLAFWEVFDRVVYGVEREEWSDRKGREEMLALRERVLEAATTGVETK